MSDTTTRKPALDPQNGDGRLDQALARVREALRGLSFGHLTLVVHDGAIVQVERTEKIRFVP